MEKKQTLNRKQIEEVVYKSVLKLLKEDFFHRTYRDDAPQSVADVISGNGWSGRMVQGGKGVWPKVARVYQSSDAIMRHNSDSLPFEKLVDDLNVYYQDKGARCRAEGAEEFNGEKGSFIIVNKI